MDISEGTTEGGNGHCMPFRRPQMADLAGQVQHKQLVEVRAGRGSPSTGSKFEGSFEESGPRLLVSGRIGSLLFGRTALVHVQGACSCCKPV